MAPLRFGKTSVALLLAFCASSASSAYFTSSLGSASAFLSDSDDCFEQVLFGPGQTFSFFGRTYDRLFVGANGFVTFGAPSTQFTPEPLLARFAPPMIAVAWTDLDSRNDAASNLFVNTSTPGQIVVTWDGSGHFAEDYKGRTFAQLVVRSNEFAVPPGEGQIGLFYGAITDPNPAIAGLSNGNPSVNDGDLQIQFAAASGLSNRELWLASPTANVSPIPRPVPEPGIAAAIGVGLLAVGLSRALSSRSRS